MIKEKMNELMPDIIKSIQRLVAIESVQSEALPDAPFGMGPKKAMDEVLLIAEELGFETKNIDNKVGYASYGKGDKYLGIFGHVDVVELGEGWTYDPLGSDIANNKMYGRGVLDNKGPILLNLYALYAMKELGITFDYEIRIVFGANEESGFECIKHYLEKESAPFFGWTPDCKWPVIYGERGRLLLKVKKNKETTIFNDYINNYFLSSPNNGKTLGIDFEDEHFGMMIMRGFKLVDDGFQFSLSYPAVKTADELEAIITGTLYEGLTLERIHNWDPVLNDHDNQFVKELSLAYQENTGLDAKPLTTTGGTYAKLVPNIVAYGPSFPGQNGIAHLPDEWFDLDDLKTSAYIYADALYRLGKEK